jgi:hypothetical protein
MIVSMSSILINHCNHEAVCRYQWPRGLRRRSAAAHLLRSSVRIPPGAWMFVCCECCVLSGRCLCDELITRPEESYRLWCVVVCDLETSRMRRPWPAMGRSATKKTFLRTKWSARIRPSVAFTEYHTVNVAPSSHSCYVIIVLLYPYLTIIYITLLLRHCRMLYADVTSS